MTHSEAVLWLEQLENSLTRAEAAKKDIEIIVALRLLYKLVKDIEKETR